MKFTHANVVPLFGVPKSPGSMFPHLLLRLKCSKQSCLVGEASEVCVDHPTYNKM